MSERKLRQDADRWYRQATDDLEAGSALLLAKKYAQTCFYTQQAAEKGIKAVCYLLDTDPQGHSCGRLIQNLPEVEGNKFSAVVDSALELDKFYIATRYPDALADLIPSEAFTQREAQRAISLSQEILGLVKSRIYGVSNNE